MLGRGVRLIVIYPYRFRSSDSSFKCTMSFTGQGKPNKTCIGQGKPNKTIHNA